MHKFKIYFLSLLLLKRLFLLRKAHGLMLNRENVQISKVPSFDILITWTVRAFGKTNATVANTRGFCIFKI